MYLSQNSRYVLKRARVLSPKIFKVAQNNLSVKTPNDDPSRPPLRVNIPQETSEEEPHNKTVHNVGETVARSFTTAQQPPPTFNDELFPKETEIRLSNFVTDKMVMSGDLDKTSTASAEPQANSHTNARSINKDDQTDNYQTSPNDTTMENTDNEQLSSQSSSGEAPKEASGEKSRTDPKSLYIIIDVPEYGVQKASGPAAPELEQEMYRTQPEEFDPSGFKAKIDRQKEKEETSSSKFSSKLSGLKKKLNRAKKFDINEIEEPATYVFHLRLNKQMAGKPSGVECVPEKEVKTRNENLNSNYVHIKIADSSSDGNVGKKVSSIEDFPNVKYAELVKKHRIRKSGDASDGSKVPLLRVTKSSSAVPPQEGVERYGEVDESEDGQSFQKYFRKGKNFIKKNLSKYELDFGSSKPKEKSASFSWPIPRIPEMKQEGKAPQRGEPDPGAEVRRERSASAAYPGHQYAKVETEADEYLDEYPQQKEDNKAERRAEYTYTEQGLREQIRNIYQPLQAEAAENSTTAYGLREENQTQQTSYAKAAQREEEATDYTQQEYTRQNRQTGYFKNQEATGYSSPFYTSPYKEKYKEKYTSDFQYPNSTKAAEQQETAANPSPYFSIFELQEQAANKSQNQSTNPPETSYQQKEEITSPYVSIHELAEHKESENKNPHARREPQKKQCEGNSPQDKPNSQELSKSGKDTVNFQTSSTCVSIGCEKITRNSTKFCAAFPPLLNEALKNRMRFGKDFFLNDKFGVTLNNDKSFDKNSISELSENSILFPKEESEKFDCESLFGTREETILNIIKNFEEKKSAGKTIQTAAGGSAGTGSSVDGLTIMKKVKEIVQFDLDNVVKIFDGDESKQDVSSVLLFKDDTWKVDLEELKKQREKSVKRMENAVGAECGTLFKKDISGDKITEDSHPMKYLPSAKENEMKLDSVIRYDSNTQEFLINKDALAETIVKKTNASPEEVTKTLNLLAESNTVQAKGGDSILVFDDETQSWKVDFSILEKREQQLRIEEELTKRSELILETFEQLEKGHIANVPLPDSRSPKTFDYKNEQWNSYVPDKKSKESSTKSKSPFKEPDAEEIRKKNSDLYENLFVANKKDDSMNKPGKTGPQADPLKPMKKSKSFYLADRSQKPTGSGPQKSSESTPMKPPEPPKDDSRPPPPEQGPPPKKEDDNFWETFLNMNILPRDIREIAKLPPPKPSEPSPTGPAPGDPKKIDEPRFKIRIPFIKDRPTDTATESKGDVKREETPKKPPKQPDNITTEKKEKPALKVPPPPPTPPPKEDPKKEKPLIGSSKVSFEIPKLKDPPPKTEIPKVKDQPPKTENPPKKEVSSKTESPKLKDLLPKTETPPKKDVSSKSESPKLKDPPSKTEIPKNKEASSKTEIPQTKDAPSKTESPKTKDASSTSTTKIQDPKPDGGKNDKLASATDHYVSDKIIEISRNKSVESQPKIKTNKIETVKLNITPDKRLPSKVTEINLGKKTEEKVMEAQENPTEAKNPSDGTKQEQPVESKTLYKNLEKYKTPFSDPDYEEKALKIKSDMESNPNLKKLDNWNKTLVLQEIMKPPENIENWLKDETDKMATLLLKVLQEAADGKPKKKHPPSKPKDKQGKGNPYDNIRKKQETTPENFLFRVRTVNWSLENDKKAKQGDSGKVTVKPEQLKEIPVQPANMSPPKVIDGIKVPETVKEGPVTDEVQVPTSLENTKATASDTGLEAVVPSSVMSKEFIQANKLSVDISEEIPGPELLKKISNAWKMFPIFGSQMTIFTLLRMFQLVNLGSSILGSPRPDKIRRHAFTKLFRKYGPIVNVQGPLSGNVILIHSPEHLSGLFDQDVTTSVRSVFDSLEQSRREVDDIGISVGLSTDWTKPEWSDLKKGTIDTIIKGSANYFRLSEAAADSMLNNIRRNRNVQNCISDDFMEDIKRWSLEALCNVLFEKSTSFLERRTGSLNWNMEPEKMHLAIEEATRFLNKCERGFQMWRLMSTPSAMGLGRAYRSISSILAKAIYQAEMNLKGKGEILKNGNSLPVRDLTFLESMLLNDGMTTDELTCNLVDIMLIGMNSMSSAMGFLLYNLAQNVKVQMKLLRELKDVLPTKDSPLNYTDLNSLKYLQACLKESLRLNFPVPLFYRHLQNDILLANYIVPKGTYVVMDFRVSSMKEQIFDDPDKFIPERWLLDEKWMKDLHPFGSFPFCHGPRAEMAKKIVEMHLLTSVAKIIRNFHIEYQYGEIQGTDSLISVPDRPLKLNFVERDL